MHVQLVNPTLRLVTRTELRFTQRIFEIAFPVVHFKYPVCMPCPEFGTDPPNSLYPHSDLKNTIWYLKAEKAHELPTAVSKSQRGWKESCPYSHPTLHASQFMSHVLQQYNFTK